MASLRRYSACLLSLAALLCSATTVSAQTFSDADLAKDGGVQRAFVPVKEALGRADYDAKWPEGLPRIGKLLEHPSHRVRRTACATLYSLAIAMAKDDERRHEFVEYLTARLSDPSRWVRDPVGRWLLEFPANAFNKAARANVRKVFTTAKSKAHILLMGMIDPKFCLENTRKYLSPPMDPKSPLKFPAWWVLLVSARNGDEDSMELVLDTARAREEDASTRGQVNLLRLLGDLEYVRHPEMVKYFERHLFSDRVIPGNQADISERPYSRIAAGSLARMLKGFPMSDKNPRLPAPISECRQWMKTQKQWTFK